MPSYAYRCPKCLDVQIIAHSMADTPTVLCAACSVSRVKVPQTVGVAFKGGGWGKDS